MLLYLMLAVAGLLAVACSSGGEDEAEPPTAADASETAATAPDAAGDGDVDDDADVDDDVAESETPATDAGPATVVIPRIPLVELPPLTELTDSGELIASAVDNLSLPFGGASVFGAECGDDGTVVTQRVEREGIFAVGNDGSGVLTDGTATVQVGGDGSGVYVKDDITIAVESDGSGTYVSATHAITTQSDGSGEYVGGGLAITVNSNGSGVYTGPNEVIRVEANGSGEYESGDLVIVNNGDGSGLYVGPEGVVEIAGDGTGTLDGLQPVLVEPLPPMPLIETFPPLDQLSPIGPVCATIVRLDASVLFDFDSADLRPEAEPVLRELAEALTSATGPVEVVGHTDSIGEDAYNLDLSTRRAQAVADALVGYADLGGVAITATGLGETQPLAANENADGSDNPAGRQANRRVEVIINQ